MATQLTAGRRARLRSQVKNTALYELRDACSDLSSSGGTFGICQTVTSQQRATQAQKHGKASQALRKRVTQTHTSLCQREQDQALAYCSQGRNVFRNRNIFSPNTDDRQRKEHKISKPNTVVKVPVEYYRISTCNNPVWQNLWGGYMHLNVSLVQENGADSKPEN